MYRLPDPRNQHYRALQPAATHFRPGTCREVNCPHYVLGWKTLIDERTGFGQAQASYIRRESGRQFKEERQPDGLTAFIFTAGQKCFGRHRVALERPAIFLKEAMGNRRVLEGQDWIDDMQEGLYKIKRRIEAG